MAKDLQDKSRTYAEVGIAEYWVIDLSRNTLIVFRQPATDAYASRAEYQTGSITPLAFPDVAIAVNVLIS